MREIKFKGKRKDNGEWVYGYYVLQPDNKDHFDIHWILTGNDNVFYGSGTARETFEKFEVIPETVGQYTGLKDKNGKEIYEGDKCDIYGEIGVIVYDAKNAQYIMVGEDWETNCLNQDDITVIGNIHEASDES